MTDHLQSAESFASIFQGQANGLAMMFGGPLYLVGSMLTSAEPGDIDIRCMLTREDAEAMFGEDAGRVGAEWSPAQFALHREELKQSRRLTRRWGARWQPKHHSRIDFQFQLGLMSDVDGLPIFGDADARPRLRLDKVPTSYFAAGRGDP